MSRRWGGETPSAGLEVIYGAGSALAACFPRPWRVTPISAQTTLLWRSVHVHSRDGAPPPPSSPLLRASPMHPVKENSR